jgi:hypothetical protein
MGCCSSKPEQHVAVKAPAPLRDATSNGEEPMTNDEIEKRIECAEESKSITLGGIKIRYAYLSQRGYYPEGKNNESVMLFC